MTDPKADLCYPALTPFKFRGVVVKPPAFVQMSADEARLYQAAGVIGGEDAAVLAPESETDGESSTESVAEAAQRAAAEAEAVALAEAEARIEAEKNAQTKPAATPKKAATKKVAK